MAKLTLIGNSEQLSLDLKATRQMSSGNEVRDWLRIDEKLRGRGCDPCFAAWAADQYVAKKYQRKRKKLKQ